MANGLTGTHVDGEGGWISDDNLRDVTINANTAAILGRTTPTAVDLKITAEHNTERAYQSVTFAPTAAAWRPLTVYKQSQLVTSGGLLYSANADHTSGTPTITLANWTVVGGGTATTNASLLTSGTLDDARLPAGSNAAAVAAKATTASVTSEAATARAAEAQAVLLTGAQTVGGLKNFTTAPTVNGAAIGGGGTATTDASLLTSGTLADARLPVGSNAATIATKAPLVSPAFTGTPTVNGSAIGTGGSATVATAAKGATFVVRKDPTTGFWPTAYATDGTPSYTAGSASTGERYTARDDVTIIWKGAPPFPPTVVSPSTAGVRDNVDFKFEEPV